VKSGTQDKIEATQKHLRVKIKEKGRQGSRNPDVEAKGDCDQIEGNAQKRSAKSKKVFGK